ncbi:motility associated factor glycosyltransferase family protein [Clostridium sp. ZS2-4]|uniref:motility associated factor glycosyltransferase family protein n=1 Tax=Clostridium sp. ZS2-4 TaxID=2987703 RepID=UPI00227B8186|nr:6-hydroxymethylpterin diphosphokinase MptE-like protein [Clostridium sp. ZS2-4]MCY6353975.1 DUF115 domain-containing protein [Clostridium sp. ZS2-4]
MNEITKRTIELINNIESKETCYIETSRDNKLIIRIEREDKLRYIGSKYSVERDVETFYKDIAEQANSETIFLVFGLGAGEHIRYLYDRIIDSNKILIIEPSVAVIKEILKINHISDILQDDRIALCYLDDGIRNNLNDFIEESMMDNTKIAAFSNYNVIFEEEYRTMLNELENIKEIKRMGNNTFNAFAHIFFNNFIENIFALDEFYTVNYLKDMYKDKPAVIVSAGPSLTKNIHLLKDVQDKFIIICGPRTIGTLIKNDIRPDFICSVDPQDETYALMKDYINSQVPLVFMDSTSNKIVKEYKGLKIIAANQGMENYLEEMLGIKVDSLMQGGSVAHFCMGLAVYIGCSNVIFIGQDLAYTNEKFQADGTYAGKIDELKYRYEKNKEKWNKDKNYSLYVPGIYGQMVRTSNVLNSYRQEFEELIYSCSGIKFINSSEGGANIKGTEAMDLKDSIRMYAKDSINKNIKELLGDKIILDEDIFIKNMFKIIDKLEIIKKACEEGLAYSDKMLYFYKDNKYCDVNKVFNELDKIDGIINNKENLRFIAYKVVSLINNVMENDYYRPKENESEKELGIRLAKKSFDVYLVVLQTVEDTIFRIKDKFSFINLVDSDIMKKVFLKRNLDKKIAELKTKYPNLKEFDYEEDIDWEGMKRQGIRCIINEDKRIDALYKIKEKIDINNLEILYGNKETNDEKVSILSRELKTLLGYTTNHSSVIITRNFNLKEESILYLKINANIKENYIYFRFFDKQDFYFYEKNYKEILLLNTHTYLDIYIGNNILGYALKKGNEILFDYKLGNIDYESIDVILDLNNSNIIINNKRFYISKHVTNKYIKNNVFVMMSNSSNKYKYELYNIEYGIKNINIMDILMRKPNKTIMSMYS